MTTTTETVSLMSIAQSNPTLNDLIWLVKEHNDYFTDLDLAVLDYYEKSAKNASNRSYYLYGQLPISQDEPITPELLLQADDMTSARFREYGGPVNSFEAASIAKDLGTDLQTVADSIALAASVGVSSDLEAAAQGLGYDSFAAAVSAYNEQYGTNYSVEEAKESLGQ